MRRRLRNGNNQSRSIVIGDESTWPSAVSEYLRDNSWKFKGWQCNCAKRTSACEYDSAVHEIRDILRHYSLIGYHCTKLTGEEIESVRSNGLCLQNSKSLAARIDRLVTVGVLTTQLATKLKCANQADEQNRVGKLWFCFFEPHLAGQSGIERFLRSWGGEALYNSHERRKDTGDALRAIGTPCVVVASVPISFLVDSFFPDASIVRAYLWKRRHKIANPIEHEGFSTKDVPLKNLLDIIEHPSDDFIKLTRCNEWEPPLANL